MTKITCTDILGNSHTFEENEFIDRKSVYGVYVENGCILLVKDSISGYWEFPGGGLKNEKNIFLGLKREFFEETGLHVKKHGIQLTCFTEFFYDLRTHTPWKAERCFYLVTEVYGKLRSQGNGDDTAEARMVPLKEIHSYKMKANIKNTIKSLS
jgi:8-oxo-dGTP pyrophosphatase MutT (NUDIX family)